jgi:hypothetical protein
MSAWIKTSSSASKGIISKWGTTGTSGYEWIFWTVGAPAKIRLNLNDGTNLVYRYRQGSTNVDTGEWVHAVVTYDGRGGNDANDGIKIYVNGQEESSYTNGQAGTYVAMHNTPREVQIGAYNSVGNFNGEISNAEIWGRELIDSEVLELYNNGQPLITGTQPQEANLKAWYKLNQSANYDEGIGPWDIEIVGTPNYSGTADGCYTTGTALRYADTNDQTTGSGNYFRWLTPLISCQGTIDITHTLGGEYVTASSGVQLTFQYSKDGAGWVTYHNELVSSSSSTTPVTFTITSATGLSCNNNIRVRVLGACGLFNASYIQFYNIKIADGTKTFYEQNFNSYSSLIGYNNGNVFNQSQVGNYIDPVWQISDASAPYQKSMNMNAVVSTSINDRFNSFDGPRGMNTNVGTYSCWVNLDSLNPQVFMDVPGYASREFLNFRIRSNGALQMEMRSWSTQMLWDTVSTTPLTAGKWHHIVAVGDGSNVVFYIDGQLEPSYIASGSYRWWNNFATLSYPNVGHRIYLGSGTYPTRHSPMNGRISNAQIWNTNLNGAQILDLYNNGKPLQGTQPAAENLLAWYKLDENNSSWINYNYLNNVLVDKWYVKNSVTPTPTSTEALNFSGNYQDGVYEGFEISDTSVNGSITLSLWYKRTGSGLKIFDFENSGSTPYASVRINSDDIFIYSNDNSSRAEAANRISTAYNWINIIIHIPNSSPTFDATQIRWWQNGVEEPTLSVIGSTTWNAFQEVRGLNVGAGSGYSGFGSQFSNWAWFEDLTINDANIETIYNNGTPGDLSTLNPKAWYKLDSTDITFSSSGPKSSALSIIDSSSNGNNANGPYDYDLAPSFTSSSTSFTFPTF